MNRIKNIVPLILLLCSSLVGLSQQELIKTLSIYFPSNVYALTDKNKLSIDSLFNDIAFESIMLNGYADSVGNAKANHKISLQRTQSIKSFILGKIPSAKISSQANGEIESSKHLKKSRRVDIVVLLTPYEAIEETQNGIEQKKEIKKEAFNSPKKSAKKQFKEDLINKDHIVLENVLFESGKNIFLYNEVPNELYYLADVMDSISTMKIHLEGHVCCIDNKKLSVARAKEVYLFLRVMGIDKHRITYEGFSNTKPRVEEKTAADQKLNRRVEITILEK